jgi:hypothetical protein
VSTFGVWSCGFNFIALSQSSSILQWRQDQIMLRVPAGRRQKKAPMETIGAFLGDTLRAATAFDFVANQITAW